MTNGREIACTRCGSRPVYINNLCEHCVLKLATWNAVPDITLVHRETSGCGCCSDMEYEFLVNGERIAKEEFYPDQILFLAKVLGFDCNVRYVFINRGKVTEDQHYSTLED